MALHVFACVGARRFAMRIVSHDLCVTSFIADVSAICVTSFIADESGADWFRGTPCSS